MTNRFAYSKATAKSDEEIDEEEKLFDTLFAFSKEFKWTPQYTYYHLPVKWFRKYTERLSDMYAQQEAAMKGKGHVPSSELRPERIRQKNERLARMTGKGLDKL